MLNNTTTTKLHEMKLSAMATAFRHQSETDGFSELSFEERFGLLVDAEWTSRRNNRLTRLLKKAGFSEPGACLEDIEYHADRKLDKAFITRLGSCNYIDENHNVIILGATGSGKTYIANALGVTAGRNFYPVRYVRLPDLLAELSIARAEGNYRKVMKGYRQARLLILDEWLLYPLKDSEARDLLELTEARYKKASTIFCSQFDVGGWHQKIGEATLADAICDRIVHDSCKQSSKMHTLYYHSQLLPHRHRRRRFHAKTERHFRERLTSLDACGGNPVKSRRRRCQISPPQL